MKGTDIGSMLARLATALLLGCGAAGSALGDDSALPAVQHSGDISYLSGGVGKDESDAIKAVSGQYALSLTFVSRIDQHDTYDSPDALTILKADGAPVLDLKPDGPFVLINLPAGKYRITAALAAWSKTLNVEIAPRGHKKLVFEMPESGPQ